ncbi:MAG: holdfast anchoring protein HfaA [Robiginitomaculum sp.]|nr:holdfast anchoring protein HfaA [Robiginitomaculum sp.]
MQKPPKHKHSNPLTNTALCLVSAIGFSFGFVATGTAQTVTHSSELNIPYGRSYRDENTRFNPSTRGSDGNRLIVNGRIVLGNDSSLSGGIGSDFFGSQGYSGSAIGNQLNVITTGSWNTVIIDSTQINNGNQTVNLNTPNDPYYSPSTANSPPTANDTSTLGGTLGELNGRINLND